MDVEVAGGLSRLTRDDSGEVLTLQRAAFVTEAQLYRDASLPPLTQTLAELRTELGDPWCYGWGIRESGRMVASVRVHITGDTAELCRLAVAPDRQGHGLGTRLLTAAEQLLPPQVRAIRLFAGDRSDANLRLYERYGYRKTHSVPVGSYRLVHLTKPLPGKPAMPARTEGP